MSRNRNTEHLRKGDVYSRSMYDDARDYQATWCGDALAADWTWAWAKDSNASKVCGKCSQAYAKSLPANGFRLGKSLTEDERKMLGVTYGWRAMYPILGPDGHYGFVGFPTGWGGRWHIRRWETNARYGDTSKLSEDSEWKPTLTLKFGAFGEYGSAEAALADMPRLTAACDVMSRKATQAHDLAWVRGYSERRALADAQDAARLAERAIIMEQRAKDKEAAQQAFYEVFNALATTDHQREGLRIVARFASLTTGEAQR